VNDHKSTLPADMDSPEVAPASSSPTTQETSDRRKSGRAIRKPDLFAEEHHEGSLLSNGPVKRKRQPNGDATLDPDADELEDEDLVEESEGSANEELKERTRKSRNKKATTKPMTKRAKITNGTGTTLAIRSANLPSKSASQRAKVQNARSRQSQVNQEGLYGKRSECYRLQF